MQAFLPLADASCGRLRSPAANSKTVNRVLSVRGFESPPLRHLQAIPVDGLTTHHDDDRPGIACDLMKSVPRVEDRDAAGGRRREARRSAPPSVPAPTGCTSLSTIRRCDWKRPSSGARYETRQRSEPGKVSWGKRGQIATGLLPQGTPRPPAWYLHTFAWGQRTDAARRRRTTTGRLGTVSRRSR
jgi:hypothetical protein